MIPNAQRINRGNMVLSELVETSRSHDFTDIVVLHEHRGEPGVGAGAGSCGVVWTGLTQSGRRGTGCCGGCVSFYMSPRI